MSLSERTLRTILARYVPSAATRRDSVSSAKKLATQLRPWRKESLVKAFVFGSVAKRTDITGGADVDLFVSLSSRVAGTLPEIRQSLFDWLYYQKSFVVRRQNVSIRVHYGGKKIDVVPGKRISEYGNDHYLWSREGESRTKTNIQKQIQRVARSHRQKEIRLAKIWRSAHGLECPSFLLELAVMRALSRRQRDRLAPNFEAVLRYLATKFSRARLTDPGNAANIVSMSLDFGTKERIAAVAAASLDAKSTALVFGL